MELMEIEGLFAMDCGAPSPIIIATDGKLLVTFYADAESNSPVPQMRNVVYDSGVISIKFTGCLKHTFGIPGDEALSGHPYYKLGMRACSFYELKDSDLIRELQNIEKVHPYYSQERWNEYKHYILTFKDNMLECIATGFEVSEENTSLDHQAAAMLNELFEKGR